MRRAEHILGGTGFSVIAVGVVVYDRVVDRSQRGAVDWLCHIAFCAGGVLGGRWSSGLPDRFDPPTSPRHRSFAHSFLFALPTSIVFSIAGVYQAITDDAALVARRQAVRDAWDRRDILSVILDGIAMLFREFAAGFATAIAPGYLSHLSLDATTPMGLPMLFKG